MVILCFSYWVTTHLTDFHSGLPFLQSQQYMRVPVSLHLLQNLLFLFVLLVITIIVGVKWYLMVIFICISLMAKDVEHLFLCFLDICTSALEECLLKSFAHFSLSFIEVCLHAKSLQSCLTLCNPMDHSLPGFSVQWDFSGKNTGIGCHVLLQGIFLTQG